MNDCAKFQEMISSMLDGELSEQELSEIKEHIALCPECVAMYEDFAALSAELGETLSECPASLHGHIMEGLRKASPRKKPKLVVLRPYIGAAACLVIVAGLALSCSLGRIGIAASESAKYAKMESAPAAPAAPAEPAAPAGYSFDSINDADYGSAGMEAPMAPEPEAYEQEAPAEPAEPAAPADPDSYADERQLWLGDYAAYIPGTEIGEAWLTIWHDESGLTEHRSISDTALLTALLSDTPAEVAIEAVPEKGNILAEIYCEGEYRPCMLYFIGENVIVRTASGYYMAAGSAEDFLQIK